MDVILFVIILAVGSIVAYKKLPGFTAMVDKAVDKAVAKFKG